MRGYRVQELSLSRRNLLGLPPSLIFLRLCTSHDDGNFEMYKEPIKFDVLCDILKDRLLGFEGSSAGLYYDKPSRRFFVDEESLDKRYGWDNEEYSGALPFPPPQLYQQDEEEIYGRISGEG